jgi:hypothetical protein
VSRPDHPGPTAPPAASIVAGARAGKGWHGTAARRDHEQVEGATGVRVGGRTWFVEDDRPGRRLSVRARPVAGQVSLSFWDGPVCRATFHLPAADIPRLLSELTSALDDVDAGHAGETGSDADDTTTTLRLLTEGAVLAPE